MYFNEKIYEATSTTAFNQMGQTRKSTDSSTKNTHELPVPYLFYRYIWDSGTLNSSCTSSRSTQSWVRRIGHFFFEEEGDFMLVVLKELDSEDVDSTGSAHHRILL